MLYNCRTLGPKGAVTGQATLVTVACYLGGVPLGRYCRLVGLVGSGSDPKATYGCDKTMIGVIW